MSAVIPPEDLAVVRVSHNYPQSLSFGSRSATTIDLVEIGDVWHVPSVTPWGHTYPGCGTVKNDDTTDVVIRREIAELVLPPCGHCRRAGL